MNLRIAICDDSATDRDYLAGLARRWAGQRLHTVQLALYPSAESFLFAYAEDKTVQILLLDIEMGQMDGVTMARTLRQLGISKEEALRLIEQAWEDVRLIVIN